MSRDFLNEIVAYKRSLLKKKKDFFAGLKEKMPKESWTRYKIFKKAISQPGDIHLIAEIKKASPSKGIIRENFDVMQLAKTFIETGAVALSVLTEEKYFLGKPLFLTTISEHFKVPLLAKDFIIDEVQIYEVLYLGASAVLLIAAILDDIQLKHLFEVASQFDLDVLVEVHSESELQRALKVGAEIIGINNRNLHTFEVDLGLSQKLIPQIPEDKVIVAESGIKTHQDILMLKDLRVNAVLIGETFLKEQDMTHKIKDVLYGQS